MGNPPWSERGWRVETLGAKTRCGVKAAVATLSSGKRPRREDTDWLYLEDCGHKAHLRRIRSADIFVEFLEIIRPYSYSF